MLLRVLAVLTVIALTAGCSSSDPGFVVATPTGSGPHAGPGKLGPVHEVPAGSCPLARADFVRNTMGMRLGRLTRLHGAGVSGCRFYALQNSPLHTSEHLPGAKQPVLEILVRRLPTAVEAHDAVVLLARTGANVHRVHLGHTTGACFRRTSTRRTAARIGPARRASGAPWWSSTPWIPPARSAPRL